MFITHIHVFANKLVDVYNIQVKLKLEFYLPRCTSVRSTCYYSHAECLLLDVMWCYHVWIMLTGLNFLTLMFISFLVSWWTVFLFLIGLSYFFFKKYFLKVRYPVLLTPMEKQMARDVCSAFRQMVTLPYLSLSLLLDALGSSKYILLSLFPYF